MQDLNLRLLPCKGSTLATELIAPTGGEGFEPPEPFTRFSGFQDHRDQPLCHPPNTSDRIRTCNNMDLNHAPLPIGSRTQKEMERSYTNESDASPSFFIRPSPSLRVPRYRTWDRRGRLASYHTGSCRCWFPT